jgi:SDR family mycofactocin-dependent oxidoreductase
MGRSHAVALARGGADIALLDIAGQVDTVRYPMATPDDLAETARLVEQEGSRCLSLPTDIRSTAQVGAAIDAVIGQLGAVDILVANAGICGFRELSQIDDDTWSAMIDTNLTGTFKCMRAVVPHMVEKGHGRIVAISSLGGRFGIPNLSHYAASKWGVIGLVKSLALEVAERGVTVNAVCPATTDTDMVHNEELYSVFAPGVENPDREAVEGAYAAMTPMRRPWLPTEAVSAAVVYLVSDEARFVSGTTMNVCMGSSAQMP